MTNRQNLLDHWVHQLMQGSLGAGFDLDKHECAELLRLLDTQPEAARPEVVATGCEKHRDFRASGPWCPVCLGNERDALREFYEGVKQCMQDTFQCPGCGHAEDWWKDCNADYMTREAVQRIEPQPGSDK